MADCTAAMSHSNRATQTRGGCSGSAVLCTAWCLADWMRSAGHVTRAILAVKTEVVMARLAFAISPVHVIFEL